MPAAFILSSRRTAEASDAGGRQRSRNRRRSAPVPRQDRRKHPQRRDVPAGRSIASALVAADAIAASTDPASERMEDLLHVDPLELEIGFRLIGLADPTRGGDLLEPAQGRAATRGP